MALFTRPRRAAIISLDSTFTSLIIVTAATFLLRVPFWGRPLDADEGLYAYGGWQMLKGLVLYRDLYDLKPPGVYFLNALVFSLSSPEALNIFICAALVSCATAMAVYLIARCLWDGRTALVAGLLFALFSSSLYIQGAGVNTEVFMLCPYMWAFYFMVRCLNGGSVRNAALAGILLGCATLFKQVAGAALPVGVLALWFTAREQGSVRRLPVMLSMFVAGALFPWAAALTYFGSHGAARDFLHWVVMYPFSYMSHTRHILNHAVALERVWWGLRGLLPLWVFGIAGTILILLKARGHHGILLVLFLAVSLAGALAGWNLFPHYFVQVVPALALLSSHALVWAWRSTAARRSIPGAVGISAALVAAVTFYAVQHYVAYRQPSDARLSSLEHTTTFMGFARFDLSRAAGLALRERTSEKDTVFVWKDRAEVNFYALRKTPSRMPIAALPNTDITGTVLEDVRREKPEYIVVFNALAIFRFDGLLDLVRRDYVRVAQIQGLPFPEQGIYRRKADKGDGRQTR